MAKKGKKKNKTGESQAPAAKTRKFRLLLLSPKGALSMKRHTFRIEGVKYLLEQANVFRREFDPTQQTTIEVAAGSAVAAHCDQCPLIEEIP